MNLEEVKKYLAENQDNEEVKSFVEGLKGEVTVGVQDLEKLTQENNEIKSWLDSQKDKHASKSLETWKSNHLESLITEEVKKRNPEKQDWEIELEKVKNELESERNEKKRESLKNKALTIATEKKIPSSIIEHFLGEDEDSTVANLTKFEEAMKTYVDEQVSIRIKDSSYTPPEDKGGSGGDSNDFLSIIKESQVKR